MAFEIEVNEGQGVMFENKSNNERAPQFKGKLKIDGQEYNIAMWQRMTKTGRPMFSLKVDRGR